MRRTQRFDLERRLETYFSTLHSSPLRATLKRKIEHWQIYAAVGGSAVAMVTGASATIIGSGIGVTSEPTVSARAAQNMGSSMVPLFKDIRLAMAREDATRKSGISRQDQTQGPSIASNGVVPLFGTTGIIQPGEWVSIYGQNLAAGTASWNGDFPNSLDGTQVTINGKAAYLSYVSPTQINLQAPDDAASGPVPVVVTTAAGSATSTVTLSQFAPSFSLLDQYFVSGIILRSDGSGAYGGGSYDILGPTGSSFGYPTVAAQPGDIVELFGVGFGPTTSTVPAGQPFSGAAPMANGITLYINNVAVQPTFAGLTSAGSVQINLIVPEGLGEGEVPIVATVGGAQTQVGVLFSLQVTQVVSTNSGGSNGGGGNGGGNGGGSGIGNGGGSGGGSGGSGGSGGGSGGGGSAALRPGPYLPRLRFSQKVANG